MSMSPYEIRLNVLQMAKEMIEEERKTAVADHERRLSYRGSYPADGKEGLPDLPGPFSPEDVISRASALYTFVNDKDGSTVGTIQVNTTDTHQRVETKKKK